MGNWTTKVRNVPKVSNIRAIRKLQGSNEEDMQNWRFSQAKNRSDTWKFDGPCWKALGEESDVELSLGEHHSTKLAFGVKQRREGCSWEVEEECF